MPITLICPRLTCRAVLCVPDHVRGKRVRCAECGITLLVPEAASKASPTPTKEPHQADGNTTKTSPS